MYRARVIPCLLLSGERLVKTVRFRKPTYVGDPINAVKIFNDREVDELAVLDISATRERRDPPFEHLKAIAGECFVPFSYGGGIRTIEQARRLFGLGVEKVLINTAAAEDPGLLTAIADEYGSQSVIAGIDVKKDWLGRTRVFTRAGSANTGRTPIDYAKAMADRGAGEILLNAIDRDGTMAGYDLDLIREMSAAVSIPLVACGGAGSIAHLAAAIEAGASAVAAGSLFVFAGSRRAVLINYPSAAELRAAIAPATAMNAIDFTPAPILGSLPGVRKCTRCVMDTTDPDITFDANGVCRHCDDYDRLSAALVRSGCGGATTTRSVGRAHASRRRRPPLRLRHRRQRRRGQHRLSRTKVKQLGLRPIAAHLDNGWDSEIAASNISAALRALEIDLETRVIDWEEFKDIQLAFLRSGVPDCEIPSDHAIVSCVRNVATRHGVRHLIWGNNTRTETHLPKAWSQGHFDWRYIKSVHRRFG